MRTDLAILDAVARALFLQQDTDYDHRYVTWDRILADSDFDHERLIYRTRARRLIRKLRTLGVEIGWK